MVLVIGHHAFLAYASFLPPQSSFGDPSGLWAGFPVVDPNRTVGFDLALLSNDLYLMSLLFFISGLFVWSSLERKAGRTFLRDRARRIGVPFLVAAGLIAPLAYYPTYLATTPTPTVGDFVGGWLALPTWPAGPAWFLWLLLVFDCVAALLFALAPRWNDAVRRAPMDRALRFPAAFFRTMVALTAAAHVPMVLCFGPDAWAVFGPFAFQTSRILHYAAWFAAGVATGAYGIERSFLESDGPLARQWARWLGMAIVCLGIAASLIVMSASATTYVQARLLVWGLTFVLACASSILAAIAIALRFVRGPTPALDRRRDNAYGMYVVHYAFVTWLQFVLLGAAWPGAVKGVVVFAAATAFSWATVAALRRIPAVARII